VSQGKPYFFSSYIIILVSVGAMYGFMQFLPKKLFPETAAKGNNVAVDSLMLEAMEADNATGDSASKKDTLNNAKITYKETYGVKFPAEKFDDYRGYQHLIAFYNKLLQLEKTGQGKVRIAYFGDSMTDGDLIVKDLRAAMQERFGGEGVGFVNITSESAQSRATLTHQFSDNWKTQSYLNVKNPIRPFGVNGRVFFAKHDTINPAWVRYKAVNTAHINSLSNPTLFYGRSGNTQASLRVIVGNDTLNKKLNPSGVLNTLKLGDNFKGFKADFIKADSIPVYGFNFDDGRGVHVDNFGTRGNSGLPNAKLNTALMKAFNDKLGYDLVVLHYGTNVLGNGTLNFGWYEKRMTEVVNHLRECFPGVTILIISTADKSKKYDTQMMTDSAVVPLAMAQKRYAVNTECAFVNLYTLMGGNGSMVTWVEGTPSLANKDYTHFNMRGAKKVSGFIYDQLYFGFEQFKAMRNGKPLPVEPPKPKRDTTKPAVDSAKVLPKTTKQDAAKTPAAKPVVPKFTEVKPAIKKPQPHIDPNASVRPDEIKHKPVEAAPVIKDTLHE
jgi:lysophospholipase L1-like esterase